MSNANLTLILGGVRSGKSRYAELLAEKAGNPVLIATAEALDHEMDGRIRRHQERRGPNWKTLEEPIDLCAALAESDRPGCAVLLDCLTLWVNNLMGRSMDMETEFAELERTLSLISVPTFVVSNEVGLGIVPDNPAARLFRDYAGVLNQMIAGQSGRVVFMAAGLPLTLKEEIISRTERV